MKINKKVKSKTCNISKNEISRQLGEGSLNKPKLFMGEVWIFIGTTHLLLFSEKEVTIHGLGAAINRAINLALQLEHRGQGTVEVT